MRISKKQVINTAIVAGIIWEISIIPLYIFFRIFKIKEKYLFTSCILLIGFVLGIIVISGACFIAVMKKIYYNLNQCDDKLFEEIDQYKNVRNENDKSYHRCIRKMKSLYCENGEVEKLIKRGEIGRIFRRKSFLQKRKRYFSDMTNFLISLIISFIASVLYCQFIDSKGVELFLILGVVVCGFFLICGMPFYKRGEEGSFEYCLIDIELNLIEQKILDYCNVIEVLDERIIDTQQIVINQLLKMEIKEKAKRKKINKDIETIENLDLSFEDSDNVEVKQVLVGDHIVYLPYDKQNGKEYNYTGNHYLISEEYSKLVKIIEKYDIITYF